MERILMFTAGERRAFASLPAGLQEGWTMKEERLDSYESPRQIAMRVHLADCTLHPDLKRLAEAIASGEPLADVSISDLDPKSLRELCFMIGARGVNALVLTLLREIGTDEDVELLAFFTTIRHKLLEINSHAVHH